MNTTNHSTTDPAMEEPLEPTGADASSSAPESATDSRVAELEARAGSLENALLRAKADFANLQRRAANERSEYLRYANAELIKSLLGVLDDLERSVAAVESGENAAALADGVRLVHANLKKTLAGAGLESIDAAGRPFDPALHEALVHQPTDEAPDGTVIHEIAKGYKLHDRVLRPARVAVAKAKAGPASSA